MFVVKACLIVFVTTLCVEGYHLNAQEVNMYGGHKISISHAPYMASIRFNTYILCLGTIINNQFILTTAFCVTETPSYYTVYLGGDQHNTVGNKYKVATIVKHESYTFNSNDYDIALLKLTREIVFNAFIHNLNIANDLQLHKNQMLKVVGWGQTESLEISKDLQEIEVPVVAGAECKKKYHVFTSRMFCAGTKGKGYCYRDQGGPAMFDGVQVGIITDHGTSCSGSPQIYTYLPPLRSWIDESIRLNL